MARRRSVVRRTEGRKDAGERCREDGDGPEDEGRDEEVLG